MSKKNRAGNREPRKPKQPKVAAAQSGSLADLVKSRGGSPTGGRGAGGGSLGLPA